MPRRPHIPNPWGEPEIIGGQWNARSLKPKLSELRSHIYTNKLSFMTIQETWLTPQTPTIKIPHFSQYRQDRDGRGGGLLTLVRNTYNSSEAQPPALEPGDQLEIQHVVIWIEGQKIHLYNIYNPPQNKIRAETLGKLETPAIIMGDLNAHSALWNSSARRNANGETLEDTLMDLTAQGRHFDIVNDHSPSAPQSCANTPHLTTSTPDVTVASDNLANVMERTILKESLGSDHAVIHIHITPRKQPPKPQLPRKTWNFNRMQRDSYIEVTDNLLADIRLDNPEEALKTFTSALLEATKQTTPSGYYKRPVVKGFSVEAKNAIRARRDARSQYLREPSVPNKINMNRLSAIARRKVLLDRRKGWKKVCDELSTSKDSKKVWRMVNSLRKENPPVNSPLLANGQEVTDDVGKANALCDHYAKVGNQFLHKSGKGKRHFTKSERKDQWETDLATSWAKRDLRQNKNDLFNAPFMEEELLVALKHVPKKKAPGKDGIHGEMLKNLGATGKGKLLELLNRLWEEHLYPSVWKTAFITPLLKPNKPANEPASYRPISLTSTLGKLMERVVQARLMHFLESNNLITPWQAGFRQNHQTSDQVIALQQQIMDGLECRKTTVAIFFDFKAAYDSVHHVKLLRKLKEIGIRGRMYLWIKNFLSDRRIQVKLNGMMSKALRITNGLPQGAVLSVLLFLLFINDLPNNLPDLPGLSKPIFADDVAIAITSKDITEIERIANQACSQFKDWATKWGLTVNPGKIQVIRFTLQRKKTIAARPINIRYDKEILPVSDRAKYLGVEFDTKASWRYQVQSVLNDASKRLHALRKLAGSSYGPDRRTMRALYEGLVLSAMEYCSEAWANGLTKTQRRQLERKHNQGLRMITRTSRSTNTKLLRAEAGLASLKRRRHLKTVKRYEQLKRMPDSHPGKKALNAHQKHRPRRKLRRSSFAEEASKNNPCPPNRQPVPLYRTHPLISAVKYSQLTVRTTLLHPFTRNSENSKFRAAMATVREYPDEEWLHVYTDGASNNQGAGGGYYMPNTTPPQEASFPTSPLLSITEIESKAILRAIQKLSLDRRLLRRRNIVVFTDSQSSLRRLKKVLISPARMPAAVEDILSVIENVWAIHARCQIVLQYITAHNDIYGNEKADRLAVAASKLPAPEMPVISLEGANLCASMQYRQLRMKEYQKSTTDTAIAYRALRPNPFRRDPADDLPGPDSGTMGQLRVQRYPTKAYLYFCKAVATPHCACGEIEDVRHLLLQCKLPKRIHARNTFFPHGVTYSRLLWGSLRDLERCVEYVKCL